MIFKKMIFNLIGVIVCAISFMALVGHVFNAHLLYDWGGHGGLSVPTAVCFFLIGIGFWTEGLHWD